MPQHTLVHFIAGHSVEVVGAPEDVATHLWAQRGTGVQCFTADGDPVWINPGTVTHLTVSRRRRGPQGEAT